MDKVNLISVLWNINVFAKSGLILMFQLILCLLMTNLGLTCQV